MHSLECAGVHSLECAGYVHSALLNVQYAHDKNILVHPLGCVSHNICCKGAQHTMKRKKQQLGRPPAPSQQHRTWVQTERAAHEAWGHLIASAPMAARLAHTLVAHMGDGNAVVASQGTLGELMARPGEKSVHRNTVRKAIQRLEAERWIEVIQIGGKGGALAYVINDRVAWGQPRDSLRYSRFSAHVLASSNEQTQPLEKRPPLRQIPTLMRGEHQVPHGPHADPPSQGLIEGMEPELPYRDDTADLFQEDQQP